MTNSGPVAAVYELPRPIWVAHDVLGKRYDTRIGPVLATVVTPTLTPSRTGAGAGPPSLNGIPVGALGPIIGERPTRLDAYPNNAATIDPEWATEYAANHPGRSTALRAVGIELQEDPNAPTHDDLHSAIGDNRVSARYSVHGHPEARIADLVGRNIEPWYTRLAEWVTVLTEQDLDHHQLFAAALIGPGLRVWRNNKWDTTSTEYTIPTIEPIGIYEWRETLRNIGACKRPALEWQLLVQAARAVNRGYYRRAVLDYAAAAEVCLSRKAQNHPSPDRRPGGNLTAWSKWLTKYESTYEEDLSITMLARTRNDAAHEGTEPTSEQIKSAAECAGRIVKAHGHPRTHAA